MSNVRDFGAAGDGKTDDTAAIQHAIDEGGGLVEFPHGDYLISRPLVADLATCGRLSFDGRGGTATLLMAGPGAAVRILGSHTGTADPAGFRPAEWQKERMPTVRDLEITGRHPAADGIHIEGVMQPTLTGVLIREVRHAMRITGRARNVIVDHCHIYHNTGVGILLDAVNLHQTIISDSHISYCALGGIRIQDSEIRNLQITGNDIEYNNARSHPGMAADAPTAEIYVDVREGSVREGTICSNTIQATYSPGGANIRFVGRGGGQDQKAGMWTITGNLIGSQENNIHLSSARGITMTGNHLYSAHRRNILIEDSRNIVISGNCFGHNPDYGDSQLCTGLEIVRSQDCVLSGLLIEDCATGENTVAGAPAVDRAGLIQLTACKRLTLSGLHLTNPSPVGFSIHDCSETVLSGCSVHETRQPAADTRSVHWIGQGNGNLIAACRLSTPTEIDESANVRTAANSVS